MSSRSREFVRLPPRDWPAMREAGRSAAATLARALRMARSGTSTLAIDRAVRRHTKRQGGTPSQLGYHGFPAAVCTSRNAVVCHGIPRRQDVLEVGDIVNIDVTTCLGGFHGDTSAMATVGPLSAEARHLVETTRRARDAGIAAARLGAPLGTVGAAVEALARREGCAVVTAYGGHGIGRKMHQAPFVRHVGPAEFGPVLEVGHAFTVEPMLVLGSPEVVTLEDGWTVVTRDGGLSAQWEHTVLMTEDGPEVLTPLPE